MQDSPLTRNFIGSPALCSLLGFSTLEPHFRQIFFGYMSLSIAVVVTELTAGSSWWIVTLTDLQQLVNLASMVPVHFLSFSFLPFLYKVFIQILIDFFFLIVSTGTTRLQGSILIQNHHRILLQHSGPLPLVFTLSLSLSLLVLYLVAEKNVREKKELFCEEFQVL